MTYTPPGQGFQDNTNPVGGGVGQSLDAGFFNSLVAGVDDADTRATDLERGAGLIATATRYPGIDPSGTADSSAALQTWLNAIPDGSSGTLPPGTYRAAGLSVSGKSVTLNLRGARFVQASNNTVLKLKGSWGTSVAVSGITTVNRQVNVLSREQTQLTLASAPDWAPGDTIRMFSDDIIAGGRPGTGGSESRVGEFATVFEVSGTTVFLSGTLRDTFIASPKAAKLNPVSFTINGFVAETPDEGMATWTASLLDIEAAQHPRIDGFKIRQGCAIGVLFRGCYGYEIRGADVRYLNNNSTASQFGYAICDNSSEGGLVDAPLIRNVRHAFTDDTARIAAGDTNPAQYGRSRNAVIRNGRAFGVSGAAWDTHHCGEGHLFTGCRTYASENGHNLRGLNHQVVDCHAVNCRVGYSTMTEVAAAHSYGHRIVNCFTVGALYQAVSIGNVQRDGRLNATISGGAHWARGNALRVARAQAKIRNVEFTSPQAGNLLSGYTELIDIVDGQVSVDGASLDMSPLTSGASLTFARLNDATSSLTGRGLNLILGGAVSRLASVFTGVNGAAGTVALDDYRIDATPAAYFTDVSAQSTLAPPLFSYATDMAALGGTPALGWVGAAGDNRLNAFLMDSVNPEDVGCAQFPPRDWAAVNVTLIWANTAASVGDVVWGLSRSVIGDGDDSSVKTSTTAAPATAPATAGILRYTTLASNVVVSPNKMLMLRIRRDGANAADTLPNDAGVVGVIVTRAA